jgi:hypothetical protein
MEGGFAQRTTAAKLVPEGIVVASRGFRGF